MANQGSVCTPDIEPFRDTAPPVDVSTADGRSTAVGRLLPVIAALHSLNLGHSSGTERGYLSPEGGEGKILIVYDEPSVRRELHIALILLGFDVSEAHTGDESLVLSRVISYDAVVLDVDFPSGTEGLELCQELRSLLPRVTILALGESADPERKVETLEAGADDYITKPLYIRELIARIRGALRHSRAMAAQNQEVFTVGDIELHPAKRLVRKSGRIIRLTPKEFDLLHYLIGHAGLPIAHSRLLRVVWGAEYANEVEYLRTFIRQLRKKLETDAGNPQYLLTDARVGYRFADPAVTHLGSEHNGRS